MKTSLKMIFSFIIGVVLGKFCSKKIDYIYIKERVDFLQKEYEKYFQWYDVFNNWMELKNAGISLNYRLSRRGIRSIAIYGMGRVGNRLVEDIRYNNLMGEEKIDIVYGIDANISMNDIGVPIYLPNDDLEKVDAIIVTAFFDYDSIKKILPNKYNVISLEELIDNSL